MKQIRPYTLTIKVRTYFRGQDENYIIETTQDNIDKMKLNPDIRKIKVLKYITTYI